MNEIKIAVLGAGFAGLEAIKVLSAHRQRRRLQITLVNQHRWALFQPLIPDLISGRICPEHMVYPLEPFCRHRGVKFLHTRVNTVDIDQKSIQTDSGLLEADFIILALGCETNYHGNEVFKKQIPGLKSVHDGIQVRTQIKQVIDRSKSDGKKADIIVVGAGYTGFEVASHAALYASQYGGHPLSELSNFVNILLVEYADTVLGNTTEGVRQWAKKFIGHYDVKIKTGVTVKELPSERTAVLTDESVYEDAMLIWTAGVAPGPVCQKLDTPKQKTKRLTVDSHLRLPGHPDIYAVGDLAGPIPPGCDKPLRMSVQFARSGGQLAAENILKAIDNKSLAEYDPYDPGYVIPLGPGHAMSRIMGHEMHGRAPFLLHYLMSVYRSWGFKNKYAVMKDLFRELLPWPSADEKHRKTDTQHRTYRERTPDHPSRT